MDLHDNMTTEQLDLRSAAIQAFSQDCHTSTSGQVDYTKYLARRGNPARGGGSSARGGGSSESSRNGSQKRLHITLANGRRMKVPDVGSSKNQNIARYTENVARPVQQAEGGLSELQYGANLEALRRAFYDWEGGHFPQHAFLAAIEEAGYTVTPKVRQMVNVSSLSFQELYKALQGCDTHTVLPASQVDITVRDPRKGDQQNHHFVVQKRRSLDMRTLGQAPLGGAAKPTQAPVFQGSGTGAGCIQGMRTTEGRAVKPSLTNSQQHAVPQQHLQRGQHTNSIIFDEAHTASNSAARSTESHLNKRKQAQQLATDLQIGKIDISMFAVGLKAIGADGNAASEAMRMAQKFEVDGTMKVRDLTRAITSQLA